MNTKRGWAGTLFCVAILAAALTAFSQAAAGENRHQSDQGDRDKKWQRSADRRDIPRRLDYQDRREYRSYYAGKVYYEPHHHYHRTYHFPVLVKGVVVHRPYYYCDDAIFLAAAVPLPRLAIHVQVGAPGVVYVHDDYPAPRRHRHHQHDDCDTDDQDDEDD